MTREAVLLRAFRRGRTNAEARESVLKQFPRSRISLPTINYIRNQLRAAGHNIPTEHAARAARK